MRNSNPWFVIAGVGLAVVLVATAPAWGKRLEEAEIYIEINDTDGDAGIQVFLDGEGWDTMQMRGPNGVEFSLVAEHAVGMQGITEFFFESAEPSFEEQTLDELLELFPAGKYRFVGTTTDGKKLKGKARLTHALPEAPVLVSPIEGEEIDADDAVFSWQAVPDPPGSEIVGYEVVVECDEPEFTKLTALVGPEVTSLTVAPEVLGQEDVEECKWEVLAIEESHNQTISEEEFAVE
jgi:hypothetical protein